MQLNLDDILIPSDKSDRIKRLTQIEDEVLINAIVRTVENFEQLPKDQEYSLAFSGGKDSHVLLATYVLYLKLGNQPLNLTVKFADTKLEHHSLYKTIDRTKEYCDRLNIPFEIVQGEKSYWFIQFALGYPVPGFRNRWCTSKLKVQPVQPSRKTKTLSGRHLGESKARDNRLNKTCGSDTCGADMIKDKYDPLLHWRNCQIWDAIFYFDGKFLYNGAFNLLKEQYEQAQDDKTGSLRLGCFMCPVISLKTTNQNQKSGLIDNDAVKIRLLLEDLRKARRIKSPRTKKNGAIFVGDRRKYWELLDKEYLLANGWIEQEDIESITRSLVSDYSYPPTYTKDWINEQHKILALET